MHHVSLDSQLVYNLYLFHHCLRIHLKGKVFSIPITHQNCFRGALGFNE